MRIGDEIVRVKGEFNLCKEGDIRVIKDLKIYNRGLAINLEGDKPDTWHSGTDFRLIDDVDMPCLQAKLAHVKRSINAFNGHMKEVNKERAARAQITKKRNKLKHEQAFEEPEDLFSEPDDDVPYIH